ncbi:carbohydrate kinase family protein [Desulfurococcaceae archaeon MEX13E-LK6-19]|nr:carbohydrate kinase family protein [Desulfurococcaceae archaeon MEX13E-LK6-19]
MPKKQHVHVAIGNLNIDITLYVNKLPGPDESLIASDARIGAGGAASNYAVAVTYYGHIAYLIASTSSYSFVDHVIEDLARIGVRTDYIKRVDGIPGIVSIIVDSKGEKIMVKHRGVNSMLSPNDVPRDLLEKASIVHIASVEPSVALEIARRANSLGVLVSYDPGSGVFESKDIVFNVINYTNILFLNRAEAKALVGPDISKLLNRGPWIIVIKKGAAGAYAIEPGGTVYHGLSKPIRKPVDTTGAGDAFAAFFNAAYLDSKDVGKALEYGLAAAALKVMCRGSRLCFNKTLFNKQLAETMVEKLKNPPEWVLED